VKECSFLHRLTLVSLWYLNSKLRNMTEWCGVGKNAWPKMTSSSDLRGHWGLKFGVWSYFHRYVNLTKFHRNRWLWLHFLDGLTRDDPDALWLLYQRFVSLVKCEWFRSRCLFCICTYGALRHDTLCILPQNFAIKKNMRLLIIQVKSCPHRATYCVRYGIMAMVLQNTVFAET